MSKCPFCKSAETVPNTVRMNHCKECGMHFLHDLLYGDNTVFDKITRSYEVLAERLVYQFIAYDSQGLFVSCWRSTLTGDTEYYTKEEAIASTVAKLKEEEQQCATGSST